MSLPDLFRIDGKVALITGATRGIGLAIAEQFAQAGASVVISSNEPDECQRVAAAMSERGLDALAVACDVSSRKQIESLIDATVKARSHIDILVCNAGVAPHMGPIATATDADWDLTMTVNLRSIHWLTSLVLPEMAARGGGSVIIMSSISGVRGNKSIGLYGLSKAASAQLARNLAIEWGPGGIRANAISPGLIRTQFATPLLDNQEVLQRRLALTPLRRVGEPHEIAAVALLLASPAGAFITGQNLIVDGGTTMSDGN